MFEQFDYLATGFSIVIGLGVTSILNGFGKLIKNREHIKIYWVGILWAIAVLSVLILFWYGVWNINEVRGWTYPLFLLQLLPSIFLYMTSELAFPALSEGKNYDLKKYYFDNRKWFFGATFLYFLGDAAANTILLENGNWLNPENGFRLAGLVLVTISGISDSHRVHSILSVVAVTFLVFFVLIFSNVPR